MKFKDLIFTRNITRKSQGRLPKKNEKIKKIKEEIQHLVWKLNKIPRKRLRLIPFFCQTSVFFVVCPGLRKSLRPRRMPFDPSKRAKCGMPIWYATRGREVNNGEYVAGGED